MEEKVAVITLPMPVAIQATQMLEGLLQSIYAAVDQDAAGQAEAPVNMAPPGPGGPQRPMSKEDQAVLDVLANS